jgi:hypothetical protein
LKIYAIMLSIALANSIIFIATYGLKEFYVSQLMSTYINVTIITEKIIENSAPETEATLLVSECKQHALHAHITFCLYFGRITRLSGAAFPSFFGYDCSINICCVSHVLQTVHKIYSIFGYLRICYVTTL